MGRKVDIEDVIPHQAMPYGAWVVFVDIPNTSKKTLYGPFADKSSANLFVETNLVGYVASVQQFHYYVVTGKE